MSSLAASRADNFYFPPEWRPEYGGISKFQGSKGANQYEQHGIVRFELPFDGWCLGCKKHVGKGTRFNAKKEKVGKYFTTILYAFEMKCASCDQVFVIKTDPANRTYDFSSGVRKMEQEYELDDESAQSDNVLVVGTSEEESHKLKNDHIYRMQQDKANSTKVSSANERLNDLIRYKDAVGKADGDANCVLRHVHREKKRVLERQTLEGKKRGVSYPILEEPPGEANVCAPAAAFRARPTKDAFRTSEKVKYATIQSQSIFTAPATNIPGSSKRKAWKAPLAPTSAELKRQRLQKAMLKQAKQNIDVRSFK